MRAPLRGEVYMVDLGMAAKIRPCVVLSVPAGESDRSLVAVIPHTTALRNSRFEIPVPVRFLRPGAFDSQGIVTVPTARLMNRLGVLTADQLRLVERGVCAWLGIAVVDQGSGGASPAP